jgi:uncharacterized delta-60 repeat protein
VTIDSTGNTGTQGHFGGSHTYYAPGTHMVTVKMRDSNGGEDTCIFHVTVAETQPTVEIGGDPSARADFPYTLHLSATDPEGETPTSWQINWGDGNVEAVAGGAAVATHDYSATGTYGISAVAIYAGGTYGANVSGTNPGALDTSFDGSGLATIPEWGWNAWPSSVLPQPDGKTIVVENLAANNCPSFMTVTRLDADGTVDTSFNSSGLYYGFSQAATLESNGDIVVDGGGFMLLHPDGTWVRNFDSCGVWNTGGWSILTTAGNKIVGETSGFSGHCLLARWNSDGTLDSQFGTGGVIQTNVTFVAGSHNVVIEPDGTIIFLDPHNLTVERYDSLYGTLDNSFHSATVSIGIPTANITASAVAIDTDGNDFKIVAAFSDLASDITLVRYNANGSLDTTFGNGGVAELQLPYPVAGFGSNLAIDADHRIMLASTPGIIRLNPNGSLDQSFGVGGWAGAPSPAYLWVNFAGLAVNSQQNVVCAFGGATDYYPAYGSWNSNYEVQRFVTGTQLQVNVSSLGLGQDAVISAGQTFTRSGSFSEPAGGSWTSAAVDYGDGSGEHSLSLNPDHTFDLSHTYNNVGSFPVRVSLHDGSQQISGTVEVTVGNAPTVTLTGPSGVYEGDTEQYVFRQGRLAT